MTSASKVPPALSPYDSIDVFHSPFSGGLASSMKGPKLSTPPSSKGSHNVSSYKYPSSGGSSYTYKQRKVRIRYPEGGAISFELDYSMRDWYDHAVHCWPEIEGQVEVPVAHASFTYDTPKFNPCVYQATKDYLQNRWGVSLHDSDRQWLASHPLATDDGIPQADFITCVHELVEPYDFQVDRVRVVAGTLMMGEHLNQWMMALGCNPFAMADRKTTNAEAAEKMGMTKAEADALWRFEFGTDLLPGSVVGEKGWSSGNGVNVGNMGGHARYVAPRDKSYGNWFGCIQLKRKESVTYISDPPAVEYVPRKGAPKLVVSKVTDPQGCIIALPRSGSTTAWDPVSPLIPTAPGSSVALVPVAAVPPLTGNPRVPALTSPTPPGMHQDADPSDAFQLRAGFFPSTDRKAGGSLRSGTSTDPFDKEEAFCPFCGVEDAVEAMLYGGLICKDCNDEIWNSGLTCTQCDETFTPSRHPEPVAYDAQKESVEWQCPSCFAPLDVDLTGGPREEPFESLMSLSCMLFMDDIQIQDAAQAARAQDELLQLHRA